MTEFTVNQILEYSKNIEQESYKFYTDAAEKFENIQIKTILQNLAAIELKHYNRINALLDNSVLTDKEMAKKIQIENQDYNDLIKLKNFPADSTPLSILQMAHSREIKTENVYKTLLSFTDLTDDIIKTFSDLAKQEEGHALKLEHLIKNYT
jgi:rubrerythrin